MKTLFFTLSLLLAAVAAWAAEIPATSVMTLYRFNAALDIPYYDIASFGRSGPGAPAGTLAQGTSVVPCLPIRNGQPLTDDQGVPYVGFQMVVDARTATPAATAHYTKVAKERQALRVTNHHCEAGVRHVLDVRNLHAMDKSPLFEPPRTPASSPAGAQAQGELDRIIRAFHNSSACAGVNQSLTSRPAALKNAWDTFIAASRQTWSEESLQRARHLDYTMRTALFEAHLDRGCSAYGACERNIIALSIRNRGLDCTRSQGCGAPGDFLGVATKVSQYNIWDEYFAQISGLTTCYLRNDLAKGGREATPYFKKLHSMYTQNLAEMQRILFGADQDLAALFPGNSLEDLKGLKHYYHAPAMGKCFPQDNRVEYISGAVASKGNDFALIANARIQVGQQVTGGYFFRHFTVREETARDVAVITDSYPGFVIDGRRVNLKEAPSRCVPYGVPAGCAFKEIGRYRWTPTWVKAGKPLAVTCRVIDRGAQCQAAGGQTQTVKIGEPCDVEMRPFTGIK